MRGDGLPQIDYNLASPANRRDGGLWRDESQVSPNILLGSADVSNTPTH
jgi:hypothetical protein